VQGRGDYVFSRTDSYIGVMIDDLTTRGVTEPYRMFTSRAEFRLSLRADNADQRLTPAGIALGCVGEQRQRVFAAKSEALAKGRAQLEAARLTPAEMSFCGAALAQDGHRRTAFAALGLPDVDISRVAGLRPETTGIDPDILTQLSRDSLYAGYVDRQARDVALYRRGESQEIPPDFAYESLPGLSNELKAKLQLVRPENLARAGKIEGMTPAALVLILAVVRKQSRQREAG
jgi:tRNA uridine 5-carboxymethylaminomethyl modification enzyme